MNATLITHGPPNMTQRLADRVVTSLERSPAGSNLLYYTLRTLMFHDLHLVERVTSLFTISAAFWIGWPFENQHRSDNAVYQIMVAHVPPWGWTALFLLCGLPSLLGCNKRRPCLRWACSPLRLRIFSSFLSVWLWVFLSAIFISDKSPGLSTIWAPLLAGYNLWVLLWLWISVAAPPNGNH